MQTTEIPYAEWGHRLDDFSLVHDGWLVSVEVMNQAIGSQPSIENLPLTGVSVEPNDGTAVVTIAASGPGGQFTHTIPDVARIRLEQRDDHADVALAIESTDGTLTLLRFRVPALPETLDGVAR